MMTTKYTISRYCSSCHTAFEYPLKDEDKWTAHEGAWRCPNCTANATEGKE